VVLDIGELRKKADAGSCVAQSILGISYLDGSDVEVNYPEAFRLLSDAAKQGASRAAVNLARMYAEGLGTPRDLAEAMRLYKAVSKVEFFAPIALGRIYSRGQGVPVNQVEALRWYSAAIEWEDRVGDCPEMEEARVFVAGKANSNSKET
jgi:TPR repeat protein